MSKTMIGTILLEGLKIDCVVGVFSVERQKNQTLLVDVEIDRDFAEAAKTDDLKYTVNYIEVAKALTELAKARRYHLLETFAEEAAALLIAEFSAERAKVTIRKPGAVPRAEWPAVRVERLAGKRRRRS